MSFQWTFIAGYLYVEVAITILMLFNFFSPRRWHRFFKSRLFAIFQEKAGLYFYIILGILSLFLMDAIREMRKYSPDHVHTNLPNEMKGNVKLFRAQRNFYITSFAIFLAFVIRRLITMLIIQAELLDKSEKIIKEAERAKNLARDTVNAQTIQAAGDASNYESVKTQLEITEKLLDEQKNINQLLEEEVNTWKQKFEELESKTEIKDD